MQAKLRVYAGAASGIHDMVVTWRRDSCAWLVCWGSSSVFHLSLLLLLARLISALSDDPPEPGGVADPQGGNSVTWNSTNRNTVAKYILEDGSVATDNMAKSQACDQCHDTSIQCGY